MTEARATESEAWQPRETCFRCFRPARVCFCRDIPTLETRTKVLILQHPREEFMPIGTARMASLCLPGSRLLVGTSFEKDPALEAALDDPEREAILLWPGGDARDLASDPPKGPSTLIVVDGTWALAKKLVRLNPRIAALPRYSLTPPRPSEYRIRAEPKETCVSTIEAVMFALGHLEGDPQRFDAMMNPFRGMIDAQIEHAERLQGGRKRFYKGPPRPRTLPPVLRDASRLVIVQGEANAYARRPPSGYQDELVQLCAVRLATGERFEGFAHPDAPVAPSLSYHSELDPDAIAASPPRSELFAAWRAFVRDDDIVVGWGRYATDLLQKHGGFLPAFVDLRITAARFLKTKPGAIEAFAAGIGTSPGSLGTARGGRRLALTTAAASWLLREHDARMAAFAP
jgi:DTW domain-containing protein